MGGSKFDAENVPPTKPINKSFDGSNKISNTSSSSRVPLSALTNVLHSARGNDATRSTKTAQSGTSGYSPRPSWPCHENRFSFSIRPRRLTPIDEELEPALSEDLVPPSIQPNALPGTNTSAADDADQVEISELNDATSTEVIASGLKSGGGATVSTCDFRPHTCDTANQLERFLRKLPVSRDPMEDIELITTLSGHLESWRQSRRGKQPQATCPCVRADSLARLAAALLLSPQPLVHQALWTNLLTPHLAGCGALSFPSKMLTTNTVVEYLQAWMSHPTRIHFHLVGMLFDDLVAAVAVHPPAQAALVPALASLLDLEALEGPESSSFMQMAGALTFTKRVLAALRQMGNHEAAKQLVLSLLAANCHCRAAEVLLARASSCTFSLDERATRARQLNLAALYLDVYEVFLHQAPLPHLVAFTATLLSSVPCLVALSRIMARVAYKSFTGGDSISACVLITCNLLALLLRVVEALQHWAHNAQPCMGARHHDLQDDPERRGSAGSDGNVAPEAFEEQAFIRNLLSMLWSKLSGSGVWTVMRRFAGQAEEEGRVALEDKGWEQWTGCCEGIRLACCHLVRLAALEHQGPMYARSTRRPCNLDQTCWKTLSNSVTLPTALLLPEEDQAFLQDAWNLDCKQLRTRCSWCLRLMARLKCWGCDIPFCSSSCRSESGHVQVCPARARTGHTQQGAGPVLVPPHSPATLQAVSAVSPLPLTQLAGALGQ